MAMGWSGSNGGIGVRQRGVSSADIHDPAWLQRHRPPLEISYFVNNICNLQCAHCYVGYDEVDDALSVSEWENAFDELISLGARTFGNVGREPLVSRGKTAELLRYFQRRRQGTPGLRFGLVTNGTRLDADTTEQLAEICPDYLDISLDGTRAVHDYIRGRGAFDKTLAAIERMSGQALIERVFISFTANRLNLATAGDMIAELHDLGARRVLISPYATLDPTDDLSLPDVEMIQWIRALLDGGIIDFAKCAGLSLYIKNDYSTTYQLMQELAAQGIIDLNHLLVDEYGVIFSKYVFSDSEVYFNYLPRDDYLVRAIRISHNGYVGNCLDMFYNDYPQRAVGNVATKGIRKILDDALPSMSTSA